MQDNFRPDAGRPTVASCKVPADLIVTIDLQARKALLPRSTWIRAAILEKLARDVTTRTDHFELDRVIG